MDSIDGVNYMEAYKKFMSSDLKGAADWITELGGQNAFMWLFYGCTLCKHFPVRSKDWYRVTRNVRTDVPGSTRSGANDGYWHCAKCFSRWTWATSGHRRLIVFGDADETIGFKEGYQFAYIGKTSGAVEQKIQFLRTCARTCPALPGCESFGI